MRLLLDTNILVFYLYDKDELCTDLKEGLFDYSNALFTSAVCVHELIYLCQTVKVRQDPCNVICSLAEAGIGVEHVTVKHLETFATLPLYDDHRDPNDRLIIAQAIADRIPLVSSDRKFHKYARYGLDFIYNER